MDEKIAAIQAVTVPAPVPAPQPVPVPEALTVLHPPAAPLPEPAVPAVS
jgi:hypothetical protein